MQEQITFENKRRSMRKILLTSTGFNNKKFEKLFLSYIQKPVIEIKAIFVPTAAIDDIVFINRSRRMEVKNAPSVCSFVYVRKVPLSRCGSVHCG